MEVSIGVAAKALGVRPETLRRWEKQGKIPPPRRTPGGTRRYDLDRLWQTAPKHAPGPRVTLAYARVSSSYQQEELTRQVERLNSFCAANGWTFEMFQGSYALSVITN